MLEIDKQESSFYFGLETLYFDQEYLKDFVRNEISNENWYVFDCGKHRWTVQQDYGTVRKECTYFRRTEWFMELYRLFNVPINIADIFFTRTPPPGIPPHVDRNRPAVINLPVTGTFFNSPIHWYSSFDTSTECDRFYHSQESNIAQQNTALLFDGHKIHGVTNLDDHDRCLLSFWWRQKSYKEILALWKSGELINWDANKKNKHVKVLNSTRHRLP